MIKKRYFVPAFKKPDYADLFEMTEDEIIIMYKQGEIAGLTILNANTR